jgi:hypothetical protein
MLFFWQGWFSLPGTAGGWVVDLAPQADERRDDDDLILMLVQQLAIGA